ncbi:MAG: hypothetical protein LBO72_04805, partial [Helicobacteraceae bacterium]|nr:hypothetical protein [Helicobacteraceae bacterium]
QAPSSWGDAKTYESIGKCVIPAGFSLFRVLGNNGFLYRISDDRRARAGYEIDGYVAVNFASNAPQRLNNGVVLKIEEIGYQSPIGEIANAKVVWRK